MHLLVRLGLWTCPREFRNWYEGARKNAVAAQDASPLREAVDLFVQGLAMRWESVLRDTTLAFRTLLKAPMHSIIVVATIAIAIAANVAVVSTVEGVLLRPLPYPHAERIVGINWGFSFPDTRDLRTSLMAFDKFGLSTFDSGILAKAGPTSRLYGQIVDVGYLGVFGARAEIGRLFSVHDLGTKNIVISDSLWRSHFGADPHVLGRALLLDSVAYQIIGVTQAGFHDFWDYSNPSVKIQEAYWRPLDPRVPPYSLRNAGFVGILSIYARLRTGIGVVRAQADVDRVVTELYRRHHGGVPNLPPRFRGWRVVPIISYVVKDIALVLWALYAAVTLLLIIACANVLNLMLVRTASRNHELTIRSALGASQARLAQQLCSEAALLASVGGGIGFALGWAGLRAFDAIGRMTISRWQSVHIDAASAIYVCVLLLCIALLTGILPAFAVRRNLLGGLKTNGRSAGAGVPKSLLATLNVAEVALTFAVMVAAGLVLRSFFLYTHINLGFDPSNLYAIRLDVLPKQMSTQAKAQTIPLLLRAIRTIPNVVDATSSQWAPFQNNAVTFLQPPGKKLGISVFVNGVGANYFQVMRVPMLFGRAFSDGEEANSSPVIVVSKSFAMTFFGASNAVGRYVKVMSGPNLRSPRMASVIGVVGDAPTNFDVNGLASPYEYYDPSPFQERFQESKAILVRTNGRDAAFAQDIIRAFNVINPAIALPDVESYHQLFSQASSMQQTAAQLLGTLAFMTLCLALAGIYGVTAYSVRQRTLEFGIRKAIGAVDRRLLVGVLGGSLTFAAIGILIGIVLTALSTSYLSVFLYRTSSFDPGTFVGVAVLITLCAAAAAEVPAVRAMRLQPSQALRYE